MKKCIIIIFLTNLVLIFFLFSFNFAEEINPISEITENDRVLILAPHPDDEAIAAGGVIQRAIKNGARLKIVCCTNGDHNEVAFIIYEKRFTFRKGEFIHMGEVRRQETISAMKCLGVNENDITFLGYPDFGMFGILLKHWGEIKPYKDFITRISSVPYKNCLSPNAPYTGESILKNLKTIISDFKPTKIFISHAVDSNSDHRALYLFSYIALWDLEDKIKKPEIFPYLVHVANWPKPRGYYPNLALTPPDELDDSKILWGKLDLNTEEENTKNNAVSFYKSQIEYNPNYLFSFVRKNELFGDYPIIKLIEQKTQNIEWQDLDILQNDFIENWRRGALNGLDYAQEGKDLLIRVTLKRKINKNFGINIFLLPYDKKIDFSKMPKINIRIGFTGMTVRDRGKEVYIENLKIRFKGKSLIVTIPLSGLSDPDYIMACAGTRTKDLPFNDTAWRILEPNAQAK